MKYRVTGLVFSAALLGACSHAEFRKMMHGETEPRVRITTESPNEALAKLAEMDDIFVSVAARKACDSDDLRIACVSHDWFTTSMTPLQLGRTFLSGEERSSHMAVLNGAFWERRFKNDPSIIGQTIEIGGEKYTIVGVMGKEPGRSADVYLPWSPSGASMTLIGRLRPGVDLKKAQAATDALGTKVKLESYKAE
jgi:hypothetical protein